MKTHVMRFNPSGTIDCLWTDALPLAEIGRLNIERASTVEFNGETQLWEVRLRGNSTATPDFSAPSRADCIAWEIQQLQTQLQ